mmetsp:Transcript_60158/g.105755  ORF Transcript_60158/g.105755 Transcript_60158/m.105755 type:complete len:98 (+) Transcript_60158:353-646(+)
MSVIRSSPRSVAMFLRFSSHAKLSAVVPRLAVQSRISSRLFGHSVDPAFKPAVVSKYIGEKLNGKRHGRGKLVFGNGAALEGVFKDNLIHDGSGVLV